MESSESFNTSHEQINPPPSLSQSLQFAFNPAFDPAGNAFVGVSVLMGTCSFTFGIPVDSVDEFTRTFRSECHKAAEAARKAKAGRGNGHSGLVIPELASGSIPPFDPSRHVR